MRRTESIESLHLTGQCLRSGNCSVDCSNTRGWATDERCASVNSGDGGIASGYRDALAIDSDAYTK